MLQQMVVCVGFWHCLLEQRLFQQEMVVELDAGLLQGAHVVVPFNLEDGIEEPPMFIVQLRQMRTAAGMLEKRKSTTMEMETSTCIRSSLFCSTDSTLLLGLISGCCDYGNSPQTAFPPSYAPLEVFTFLKWVEGPGKKA